MLTSVLLTKLPPEIRLIVTRKASSEDLDLETLQSVLEEELIARERSHDPTRSSRHSQDRPRLPPTSTTLFTQQSGKPKTCCYCEQSHTTNECHVVKDLDAR